MLDGMKRRNQTQINHKNEREHLKLTTLPMLNGTNKKNQNQINYKIEREHLKLTTQAAAA